ncbi:MAG: zinc-ribbon domain-containing protein, partial [Pyrobaculum sp.]
PQTAKFCMNCGYMLGKKCQQCGFVNPPGANFCANCGAKL